VHEGLADLKRGRQYPHERIMKEMNERLRVLKRK